MSHRNGSALQALALGALLMTLTACGFLGGQQTQTFCDGITSEVGGCDPDRPTFVGTSCDEVAVELGRELDKRALAIIEGPEDPEKTKAVRVTELASLTVSLANLHLRREGLISDCNADDVLMVAEGEFSQELRAVAGDYLWDGPPATYEEWVARLRSFLEIIDQ